jgi:uncharacterized protein
MTRKAMSKQRISVFPLAGALLFPGMQLPLHIFEPRYKAMVSDSLARDRMIGMIQPRGKGKSPELYDIGCVGRIGEVEALEDGGFNIVLEGVRRFRILRELDVTTAFRQVEAELFDEDDNDEALAPVVRAALEQECKRYAEAMGYLVDWNAVAQLDDAALVHGFGQVAPIDVAAKQTMLEAKTLAERAEQAMQLMQFYGRTHGEGGATLQ